MRSTTIARVLIAAAALAVAASLAVLERDRDRCQQAVGGAFLAAGAPEPVLANRVGAMLRDCSTAEPLTEIAVGLRAERPRSAARLARAAAARDPDDYVAWAVLATTGRPREAALAARRAGELNPLSASRANP